MPNSAGLTPAPHLVAEPAMPSPPAQDGAGTGEGMFYELIELFFFAYRDFVGGPDRILAEYSFGRAHHRVLHFVDRNPGLTIAELLGILQITKQSLNRVLKELVDKHFIDVRPGEQDRRQRLLFASESGQGLARRLARLQGERIREALEGVKAKGHPAPEPILRAYLLGLVEPSERAHVLKLTRTDEGAAP